MMDEGRAKGCAAAYMRKQADHKIIGDWLESPLRQQAFNKFVLTTQMKTDEHVVKHMAPFFPPDFSKPFLSIPWTEKHKTVAVHIITVSPETDMIEVNEEEQKIYNEKSIFLSNLIYFKSEDTCDATLLTEANVSHHTITRLLQRGKFYEMSFGRDISVLLQIARDLSQIFKDTTIFKESTLDQSVSYDFLIPYQDGALVARTLKATPKVRSQYQGDQWIFSLRTFLGKEMLKPKHHERMAGLEISKNGDVLLKWLGETREMRRGMLMGADFKHVKGWLKANARLHVL